MWLHNKNGGKKKTAGCGVSSDQRNVSSVIARFYESQIHQYIVIIYCN
jgi:hypothetical protein